MVFLAGLTGTGAAGGGALLAAIIAAGIVIFLIFLLFIVALYVYLSLAFMAIGKKAGLSAPGIAWIPGVGPLLIAFFASKMHWWPWLLLIGFVISWIPIVGWIIGFAAWIVFIVYAIIWNWKMFEAVGRPGWWAILCIIPVVNLILIGIAAWGNGSGQAK